MRLMDEMYDLPGLYEETVAQDFSIKKMWKIKIPELEKYENSGFELFSDGKFVYVFNRKHPVDEKNPDEPLAIFEKNLKLTVVKGLLDAYIKGNYLIHDQY
ncbi:MAG: hypothetical protein DRP16_02945 [Candidatus Aenigmatarchaeota archaeon]|nr:MAG: hypothetical protein DRP16_02945 [Candidatus Aenigmarchaeota archaeon]